MSTNAKVQLESIGTGRVEPLRKQAVPVVLPEPDVYLYTDGNHRGVSWEWRGQSDMAEGTERHAFYTEQQVRALLAATQQEVDAQDAARYQALVESGNFAPSPFDNGMWGLRVSRVPSTKAELDAAVDRVIAAQAKQGGTQQ